MGLQQVGNQNLFGSAAIIAPATPVFASNNGVFATVARTGAGTFVLTMDPDFALRPDDVITTRANALTAAAAHAQSRTANGFTVFVNNGNDVAADLGFTVTITRTFRG
jgi:hypothetical protein